VSTRNLGRLPGDLLEGYAMTAVELNAIDQQILSERGMTPEMIMDQVAMLRRGLPLARLARPCTPGDGVTVLTEAERYRLATAAKTAAARGRLTKFVPASGAASRMFKALHAVRGRCDHIAAVDPDDGDLADLLTFGRQLRKFAFYTALKERMAADGLALDPLVEKGRYEAVLTYLLTEKGLNYGNLPKGLILFHRYPDHSRTPVAEHLVEAAATIQDGDGRCRVHFTVSPRHEAAIQAHIAGIRQHFDKKGTVLEIGYSHQHPATDTVAIDEQGNIFRDRRRQLVFRPGGHGALISNLAGLEADLVCIKNIDNVVPDRMKADAELHQMALIGLLVDIQERVFEFLEGLKKQSPGPDLLTSIQAFAADVLGISPPAAVGRGAMAAQIAFWRDRLDRPLRVCGMVPNVGAPGGGPFWVVGADGTLSRQIVEQAHVDMDNGTQRGIWQAATHFNPVVLVCAMRDAAGTPYDLTRFRDPQAGFIVHKSLQGRPLKGLEHPGLWNGAMAGWNTVFTEIPLTNFAPVKTVLSLLDEAHQA
jgi:hypothetical protein